HTDSIGDDTYNQKLSEKRADAVCDYIIKHGISPERISAKGFGETKPIASNDTKEGRQKNRRTEFYFKS
ncbi:MAG: OmpA family protein, partial [Spirochaetes bacterium]|nr:OmpA family protein [Spirochaetota bacterium]